MKKIYSIIAIVLICAISTSSPGQQHNTSGSMASEWSGLLRIEGKENTIWNGIVTITDTYFDARNVETNETKNYYIPYPTPLSAVVEAATVGGFSYIIDYYPSFDAFLVSKIDDDSDWWHFWVDYELPMVGANAYELTKEDNEIVFGYLESWYAHALIVEVDKSEVKKDEIITVNVLDETNTSVCGATVYVNSETYTTDTNGKARITLSNKGKYSIYSEMDGFVRSDKVSVQVKKKSLIRDLDTSIFNNLFEQILKITKNLTIYKILIQ
ncbi:MAG: hypothetical protein JXA91_01770 [Candidatus Thermoplasmatota archaeon]|nr:hypothetical protein [Candidatus Thermoplasmatota archaeon]